MKPKRPAGSPLQRAAALERTGRTAEAAALLLEASKSDPAPELFFALGNLLMRLGNWQGAQLCYARCIQAQPAHASAHHNRGVALQELGRNPEAIEAFEAAIGLNPGYAAAYYGLGLAYQRLEAFDAALLAFECAAQADPKDLRYPIETARTRIKMLDFQGALSEADKLLAKNPSHAQALNLRGIALKNLQRPDEALRAYDLALQASPDFTEALNNRGNLLLLARRFSPALADLDKAMALQPDMDWLAGTRLYAALHVHDWQDFDGRVQALLSEVAQQRKRVLPLALQCMVDEPMAQLQAARIWGQAAYEAQAPATAQPRARQPGEKIRIAYVSQDFRSHPVAFLMAEVFELHDRSQFELVAINYGKVLEDPMQQRLRASFDRFLDVESLSDSQIAELCRSLGVDIAVDLTGLTEGARTAIFAWRAAPVQILYLGTLGTAGSAACDYLIADPVLIPAEARPGYTERVICLPSYQANDRQRPRPAWDGSRSALGLPENGFVYACFNNPCKIGPAVFRRWMAILQQVPGSVLWLLEEDEQAGRNLRRFAQEMGLDPARLVFARRQDREAYLASQCAADLFLDTLPYNAGTTASDALWMGLPVLTQIGQSFASRMAASLLKAAGLPELITHGSEQYVQTAVRLATQPAELADLRSRLQAHRLDCELFDTPRFTRHLEKAYREVQRISEAGEAARDLAITRE